MDSRYLSSEGHYHVTSRDMQDVAADDALAVVSPKDAPWDVHRGQADDVGMIYAGVAEFERYARRMAECGGYLRFNWVAAPQTGEAVFRLRHANFCRIRHCPICQWRRSLMWQARFIQSLPDLIEANPSARWVFLTLTVPNCDVTHLGQTLTDMNKAWQRLIKRKEFAPVMGWVRTTEVTRAKDGKAHPHFHALLMVPQSMLAGRHYVKQSRWAELWGACMKFDFTPVVDIRSVKKNGSTGHSDALRSAVVETLKYSVKPNDMKTDPEWFLEVTRQTHKRRFVATGGLLKDVFRDEETNQELIDVNENTDGIEGASVSFNWRQTERKYRRVDK